MEKDYREKIKKLLALAESPNEHEAKAALLKAKELMAEHKLSELDVKDVGKKEVKEVLLEGMQASTRHNPWIIPLSTVMEKTIVAKPLITNIVENSSEQSGSLDLRKMCRSASRCFDTL